MCHKDLLDLADGLFNRAGVLSCLPVEYPVHAHHLYPGKRRRFQ